MLQVGTGFSQIIPTDAMYSEVFFVTPHVTNFSHYLSVVLEGEGDFSDLSLEGEPLDDEDWATSDGFSYMWMSITNGSHTLMAAGGRRFAAYVYGHTKTYWGGYVHSVHPGEGYLLYKYYQLNTKYFVTLKTLVL